MSEYRERSDRQLDNDQDKIDITELLWDFWYGVKKLWWLVVLLAVVFAAKAYFTTTGNYQANYVASATVSANSMTGTTAEDMVEVFPYILKSGVLADVIAEDLGVDTLPGSIDVQAEEGINLMTISVTARDPQVAYNMLMSVMENYPQVAKFVVGETKLTILDETGVPTDTAREEIIRGSYKNGAMKGASIGLVILLLYVLTRRTVKSKDKLKTQLNLMDCGSLPHIQVKKRKKETFNTTLSLMNERISQGYVEALRKIRIKVMKEMEMKGYTTLLVTSSIPGEGKTTVAANLAIAIAKQGKRVILVDCDLRNPSIAGVMNEQEAHPGLGAVLTGKASLKEALVNVDVSGGKLKVLYGSEDDEAKTKLLGSRRFEAFLQLLKPHTDVVILDTAPSGILADAPVLAKYVDAALYVIRYDYTKLRQIRDGVQALSMSGVDILGYVFNGDMKKSGGGYGYGYGYGYMRYGAYGKYGKYGKYGSYGRYGASGAYGAYGSYGKEEVGKTDAYGRVIKE